MKDVDLEKVFERLETSNKNYTPIICALNTCAHTNTLYSWVAG